MAYKIEGIHFEQSETCSERVENGWKCPLKDSATRLRKLGSNPSSSLMAVAGRTICQRARLEIVHQSRDGVITRCHGNNSVPFCGELEFHITSKG